MTGAAPDPVFRRIPAGSRAIDIATLIDRQVDALDGLLAELRLGPRDQRHYDALEERAQTIADGIRRAFRAGRR